MLGPPFLEHERHGGIRGQRVPDDRQVEAATLERPDRGVRVGGFGHVDPRQLAQQLPPDARTSPGIGIGDQCLARDEVHTQLVGPCG